jgi:enoyl-CoA hydratase/3-hydroxyacyl-CoA dehydrogenase
MFVFKAAVVGAGTMGGQIAQTIAAAGIPAVLKDISDELVQAGLDEARNVTSGQVGKLVQKGKLTQEQGEAQIAEILARIEGTTSYEGFGDVDFVIEAVPERMDIKQGVFAELDAATPGHAILASNTSSLSITEIGEATLRPEKVVGFHYFYPASIMPLIEIVEGEETAPETVSAAITFAQAIRKQPITCAEVPGFVVNRILNSGTSEIWREQEQKGLSIKAIDEGVGAAGVIPMGPYFLVNLLGLDTVLHVAEHLAESYGEERFYVPQGMRKLVSEGKLGAKTAGEGFYSAAGEPNLPGEGEPDVPELVELLTLKTFVEACLVLEEGIATHRDIDFGLMAGAGLDPRRGLLPPFMKGDVEGLDTILERLENAAERHGERFAPPTILRRLVAQGRLGQKSGQGFYAYPQPDAEQPAASSSKVEVVKLETRADGVAIAWLANGQMNSIAPAVIEDLRKVWEHVKASGAGAAGAGSGGAGSGGAGSDGAGQPIRALVIASSNPFLYSAGADIKAFTSMDEDAGERLIHEAHALFRELGSEGIATIAAVNGLAFGGGCELAMACDMRIAARTALFGQPEIKLGIIPGFGGTQRLPRLVGQSKALEMNLIGDPMQAEEAYEYGLASAVVEDHELLDTALAWARKLAGQAPLALAQIKRVSAAGDLDAGIEAEKRGFATVFQSADAKEGIAAFLGKRAPRFEGK